MSRSAVASSQPAAKKQAKRAGLCYVNDGEAGFRRQRHGNRFRYVRSDGRPLRDKAALERIRKLAIPPAWADVWICAKTSGHLQATGRDARGRKQYRYHAKFRAHCERDKFDRLGTFALALPKIRAGVARDLHRHGLPREKVLAATVSLLETTLIRVGNEDYARQNGTYGMTTFKDRHAKVVGSSMAFTFLGKSGKKWHVHLRDQRLAKIVKACQDLPGQHLFQYLDEEAQVQRVTSTDINNYLRDLSGADITAKDFRTWSATVMAAALFAEVEIATGPTAARHMIRAVMKQVADRLGNTISICRKCYVHPGVIACYENGSFGDRRGTRARTLAATERSVTSLLTGRRPRRGKMPRHNQAVADIHVV